MNVYSKEANIHSKETNTHSEYVTRLHLWQRCVCVCVCVCVWCVCACEGLLSRRSVCLHLWLQRCGFVTYFECIHWSLLSVYWSHLSVYTKGYPADTK